MENEKPHSPRQGHWSWRPAPSLKPVEDQEPRWLDVSFFLSLSAIVALVGVAIALELRRPVVREQRIVPALGVIDRCEACHDASSHPGAWTSTHPVERFGCTTCHGGQGLATNADDAHREHPDWERPLFTALEREANCGTCHKDDVGEAAPALVAGRLAVAARGCAACHEIPGLAPPNIAPELDGLRDKVKPAWVRAWLTDPSKINPSRKMPRFDLTAPQIDALTAFLFSLPGRAIAHAELHGDSERGKIAVATRRCATCHLIDGRGGTFGPSLDTAGAKVNGDWLFAYLTDTHRVHPRTRMPGFRIPEPEATDIVAFAAEQWVPDTAELPWAKYEGEPAPNLAPEGRKLFSELGCRGCHFVESVALLRIGMPLANVADRHFGDLPRADAADRVVDIPSWISRKVMRPHAFDLPGGPPAKMPAYALDEAEARAIGVAAAALRTTRAPAAYVRSPRGAAGKIPGGATGKLVERFRCLVCHSIGGEGGNVSRVPLDGEGSRVRRPWLDGFLRSPTTLRMDQSERMPLLGIDEASAARLANWIESALTDERIADEPASTDIERGKRLFAERGCPKCHVAEGQGAMKGPVLDGARERLQPAYALAMLVQGNAVVPGQRHPAQTLPPDDARAIAAYVCSLPPPPSLQNVAPVTK